MGLRTRVRVSTPSCSCARIVVICRTDGPVVGAATLAIALFAQGRKRPPRPEFTSPVRGDGWIRALSRPLAERGRKGETELEGITLGKVFNPSVALWARLESGPEGREWRDMT
jgi:hypothetical protein